MLKPRCAVALLATLAIAAIGLTSGSPVQTGPESSAPKRLSVKDFNGESVDIYGESYLTGDNSGELLPYDPVPNRRLSYQSESEARNSDNLIKPSLRLEREELSSTVKPSKRQPAPKLSTLASSVKSDSETDDTERFGSIAFNSREVRLVGPNQKEVEMKDDVASKVVIALENLQKEAGQVWDQVNVKLDESWKELKRSDVWGQVNDKLDKSWSDLKSMVEGVVSPSSKRHQQQNQQP